MEKVSPAGLSQRRIVEAAIELIDREGLEGLGMDRLGAKLGVTGMALYRYIGSKNALLDRILEYLQEGLDPLDPALSPHDALGRLHTQLFGLMCAHPRLLAVLCLRPLTLPALVERAQENLAVLSYVGADPADARVVLRALTAFTLGYSVLATGASLDSEESSFQPVLEAMLAAMASQLPWLDRVPVAVSETTV